jgi:hypothetical protein
VNERHGDELRHTDDHCSLACQTNCSIPQTR